ncbi:hypothetical protein, conserved [Eimeria brunetti]|uniref:Abnormal spindle-like microcephaly-associated protein ASH domain-containing protein n=1 Tax=Eimeria brunetti TaxID=51314 RepID=U6LKX7_9EIME|nr:hypothetical protein, conserved [Eimeria brunetti]
MAMPSSDSDGPPQIPDEEDPTKFGFVQKTCFNVKNNAGSQNRHSTPPQRETSFACARGAQSFIPPQREPAEGTTCNFYKRGIKLSSSNNDEELCLAFPVEDDNCVLKATPERLEFQLDLTDPYTLEAVKPLKQEIVLQNVSNHVVSFVVLPPSSKAFSLSCPRKKSFLSAGMQQRMQISFCPDVCAPQSDYIKVVVSVRSTGDATAAYNRKLSNKSRRSQDALLVKRIHLRGLVHCRASEKNLDAISNPGARGQDKEEFMPFSIVSRLDFGPTKVGSVQQRRLVLPAALWEPVEFTVNLTKKTNVFSAKPLKGIIGARDPVTLWLQFAPSLLAEYTEDLLVFLGHNSTPYQVRLTGNGVPLQSAEEGTSGRRKGCTVQDSPAQLGPYQVSEREKSSTAMAAAEINPSQHPGESADCKVGESNKLKQMNPETCMEISPEACSTNFTEDRIPHACIPHRLRCPSRRLECPAKAANCSMAATNIAKRSDSSKYGEGAISKQYLDERWAELVAVLRAQKVGMHTVKGASLPSDTAVQKVQLKRAEDVQRMLRFLQIQDRNRTSCTFVGAPVAPSRATTHNNPDSTPGSAERGTVLRQQWRSELAIRLQQAASAVVLRARMARRLEAIRSWIRSHSLREETNQTGLQDKQHQNSQPNCLSSSQHMQESNNEKQYQQGISDHTGTPQQCGTSASGLSQAQGNAAQAVQNGADALTNAKSGDAPQGLQKQDSQSFTEDNRWKVKLVPPKLLLSPDSNGDWECQSIPGPEFWGKETLNVAELFTCMQHNAPLSPLSKRDADVYRLKEEDVITCTGGLEVTDTDLLQSLLEATPPLIDDKPWVRCPPSSPDDPRASVVMRSRSQGDSGTLENVTLLPPEDPNNLATVAWRFIAPAAAYSSACMQLPPIVETDLLHVFLQAATQAKANHTAKNILPPFAEIPPLRCNVLDLTTVEAGALWPPGHHQRSILPSLSNFDEQGDDKKGESAGIDALEASAEKDAHELAFKECVDRAEVLRRDSKILKNIWGLVRCEQLELLSTINKMLPQEFHIPHL